MACSSIKAEHGARASARWPSPHSTVEELYLLRQAGARPGQREHRLPPAPRRLRATTRDGVPLAGHADCGAVERCERALVIGSFLRKDHPLLAQRLRQAARKGAQVSVCTAVDDDWADAASRKLIAAPSRMARRRWPSRRRGRAAQGRRCAGAGHRRTTPRKASRESLSRASARRSCSATPPPASAGRALHALASWIGEQTGASVGFLAKRPTRSARTWPARCRAPAA